MRVEFRSRWGVYLTSILVRGAKVKIRFSELRDGGSYYVTDDKDIINALKKEPVFGVDYYVFKEVKSSVQEEIKVEKKVVTMEPDVETVESVTNINEAREYLREKKGVKIQKLNTPKSILKQAVENGVKFPNLKLED